MCLDAVTPEIRASNTWAEDLSGSWKLTAKNCMSELLGFREVLQHWGKVGNPVGVVRRANALIKVIDSIGDGSD